jgi:hypothetical protein
MGKVIIFKVEFITFLTLYKDVTVIQIMLRGSQSFERQVETPH